MSYSRRSHTSAYQVYSSHNKSGRHSRSFASGDSQYNQGDGLGRTSGPRRGKNAGSLFKSRDSRRHRDGSYDSDDEVLKNYTPKSLVASSYSSNSRVTSSGKQRNSWALDGSSHRGDRRDRRGGENKPSSLMDIDFGASRGSTSTANVTKWKDLPLNHSSDEDSYEHADRRSDWKSGQRFNKYSDTDEEDSSLWHNSSKNDRNRRSWKESSLQSASNSSSRRAPLIIDLAEKQSHSDRQRGNADLNRKPKPLLETYIPPPSKKPVSLLDLPSAGGSSTERFKRRLQTKPNYASKRAERRHDGVSKNSTSVRKRSGSDIDEKETPPKKLKVMKGKTDAKEKSIAVESNKISVCKSSGHTFLIIPSTCSTTYIHGRAKITILIGTVNIMACDLEVGSTYDVYSPASGSLLAMIATESNKIKPEDVREKLAKHGVPENDRDLENIPNNTVAVVMLDRLDSAMCDYVTTFIPYTQLFTAVPSREIEVSALRGVTLPKLGLKVAPLKEMVPACMNMSQDYEEFLDKWCKKLSDRAGTDKPPIVLCCGAKNTGKSTFNRMLINSSLKCVNSVAYLECDVGQTEFSPPATLSLNIVKQPVLGPPFCHQHQAERMVFYGDVSPTQDPSQYIKCLKFVVEAYKELTPCIPLIVNTMGFPEGIGLMLLIDIMNIVEPDLVVQIESFNQAANFPPITQELVALDEGWTYNKTPAKDPKQKMSETHPHELMLLSTLVSQRRDFSFKLKPVDLRNLSLLSALSAGLERGMTLNSMPPYIVPYKQLGIHVCHHRLLEEEILTAIDASVVALCVADLSKSVKINDDSPFGFREMPVCKCLGLGIVRGVDTKRGLLYLVTTLPRGCLRKMNTLLKGCLSLPDQIILKQKSANPIPYVDALAPSTAVTAVRPRSRMPRISLGGKN